MIREMHHIDIRNVRFNDANETFWRCSDIKGYDIVLRGGSYPFMFSKGIKIDGLKSDSKYPFNMRAMSCSNTPKSPLKMLFGKARMLP